MITLNLLSVWNDAEQSQLFVPCVEQKGLNDCD